MKILIHPTSEGAVKAAALQIADLLAARPEAVLGLATGGTMEPVYAALIDLVAEGQCRGDRFTSFNLDEYVGLSADHPQSYHHYMRRHLFDALGVPAAQTHLPAGDAPDLAAEAQRYEARIAAAGGIDLQLLGIGANGHIGFNEPSSSLASRTRVKTLTRSTVEANRRFFAEGEAVPVHALTMGIGTVMDARHILLLATGAGKARAVAGMAEGPVSAACPASILQMHPSVVLVCDRAAAADLRMTDYYETVHPDGAERTGEPA
ncbi:glucosamine-6-phosphate deaminase [Falsirhodobacter algicola]|uniref:Glucosamine-6-phosphate deaminase n=1 Tax=Falsirhodobacter algicola TaxID=2692330 RepID=A0A8J8MVP3_9RHOB|nr:glucosamine-6-phosphate deaminase [Falsirhodobacter algicola]QUS37266.1 glucosamine-6-phosphate deaminase [Falsirhodobacter algicola]